MTFLDWFSAFSPLISVVLAGIIGVISINKYQRRKDQKEIRESLLSTFNEFFNRWNKASELHLKFLRTRKIEEDKDYAKPEDIALFDEMLLSFINAEVMVTQIHMRMKIQIKVDSTIERILTKFTNETSQLRQLIQTMYFERSFIQKYVNELERLANEVIPSTLAQIIGIIIEAPIAI